MSSPFFVVQAQRDLSLARTVEIQAISDYNKSLVDFEAVQQVPLTGGGSVPSSVQVGRRYRAAYDGRRPPRAQSDCRETRSVPRDSLPLVCQTSPTAHPPTCPLVHSPACRSSRSPSSPRTKRRISARPWRRSPGPTRSSSSIRTAPTRPSRSRGSTPIASSSATGRATSSRRTTPRRSRATTGFCRSTPTSASRRRWREEIRALLRGGRRRTPRSACRASRGISAAGSASTDWYPDYQLRLYDRRAARNGPAATCTRR